MMEKRKEINLDLDFEPLRPWIGSIDLIVSRANKEVSITARARTHREIGEGGYRIQDFESDGLGGIGIELYSGADFVEIAKERMENLKEHLTAYNVDTCNFDMLALREIENCKKLQELCAMQKNRPRMGM